MGDHATKSESEPILNESNLLENLNEFWVNRNMGRLSADIAHTQALKAREEIKALEERIIRMERAFDALGRRLEGSERHVEDEGWFD